MSRNWRMQGKMNSGGVQKLENARCPQGLPQNSPQSCQLPLPSSGPLLAAHRQHMKQPVAAHRTQSPGQIKRREVSWTLTKKLDTFTVQGEIKRREVVLDPHVSPEEVKSREVELGSKVGLLLLQLFLNSGATDIVFVTVPHSS